MTDGSRGAPPLTRRRSNIWPAAAWATPAGRLWTAQTSRETLAPSNSPPRQHDLSKSGPRDETPRPVSRQIHPGAIETDDVGSSLTPPAGGGGGGGGRDHVRTQPGSTVDGKCHRDRGGILDESSAKRSRLPNACLPDTQRAHVDGVFMKKVTTRWGLIHTQSFKSSLISINRRRW